VPLLSPFQSYTKLEKYIDGAWEEVKYWFGGSLVRRANSASILNITFPDWQKQALVLRYGQKVRFSFGLNGLPTTKAFLGRVTNRSHSEAPEQSWVSFECMDFLEQAQATQVQLTETGYNFDGYDPSVAIKELFDGLAGTPVTTTGVCGTNPKRLIVPADKIYFPDYSSALAVALALNDLCWDDTAYPSYSLPYFLWQDGAGVIHHRKLKPLSSEAARTLTRGDSIAKGDVRSRAAHLINQGSVAGGTDPFGVQVFASFGDNSRAAAYGARGARASVSNLSSSDECKQWAIRKVQTQSLMSETVKIETTKGYSLYPGDVVDAVDLVKRGSVKLRVTQVNLKFAPRAVSCEVALGDSDFLATEYV